MERAEQHLDYWRPSHVRALSANLRGSGPSCDQVVGSVPGRTQTADWRTCDRGIHTQLVGLGMAVRQRDRQYPDWLPGLAPLCGMAQSWAAGGPAERSHLSVPHGLPGARLSIPRARDRAANAWSRDTEHLRRAELHLPSGC